MAAVGFIFLGMFWTGTVLLLKKERWDLRRRLISYLGLDEGEQRKKMEIFLKKIRFFGKKSEMERELSESLAYIKNMVVLGRGESVSTQLLLEGLSEMTDLLSDTYLRMSQYMNVNEPDRAAACLSEVFGESYAAELGRFLAGWEEIPSEELLPGICAYQSSLREMRETSQRRRDETISDLIYFPVVLNCMAVLMNFVYVGFFLPQKEMLSILF